MALVTRRDDEAMAHIEKRVCFYCGDPLYTRFVSWMGATGAIALHPPCCEKLMRRLNIDLYDEETDKPALLGVATRRLNDGR
jgi:hypothetical protein